MPRLNGFGKEGTREDYVEVGFARKFVPWGDNMFRSCA